MEQERASLVTLMAYASYLGSCNVAVQEISQVRKENISNEQKKNDYLHTQVFNGKFQMSLATWIGRMTGRFWQRKIWVGVGLDGQVRVKTREIENVFFFFTSRTITTPLFRRDTRNLPCSVLQAYTAGRKGKYQRELGPWSLALEYFQQSHSQG